jgi:hypothetical protein
MRASVGDEGEISDERASEDRWPYGRSAELSDNIAPSSLYTANLDFARSFSPT